MEGSDVAKTAQDQEVAVGQSGEDLADQNAGHQPIGEEPGGRGTVVPRSAQDPSTQTGNPLDPATQAAIAGQQHAEGGPTAAPGVASPESP